MVFKEKNGILPYRIRENLKIPRNVMVKASESGYINDQILTDIYY